MANHHVQITYCVHWVSVNGLNANLGRLVDRNVGMIEMGSGPDLPEGPQQIKAADVADKAHVQQTVVGDGIRADPHPAAEQAGVSHHQHGCTLLAFLAVED